MHSLSRVILHHSASALTTTRDQIDQWHRDKGWSGCGYHYVVEGDGTVQVGRRLPGQGAHARGANTDSIGICIVGDNTVAGREWTQKQIDATHMGLLTPLWALFPWLTLHGHRDVGSTRTECPGVDVHEVFPGFPKEDPV